MSIILWILQVLLALRNVTGGVYMIQNYSDLAQPRALNALPGPVWVILGILQVLFCIGLVIPGIFRILPKATPISAVGLAVISLLGIALYSGYAGFPGLLWGLIPAVLYCFIAYGRFILKPLGER